VSWYPDKNGPCMCGDPCCKSCGPAQGLYECNELCEECEFREDCDDFLTKNQEEKSDGKSA